MSILKKLKKEYDMIKIPKELDYIVNKAIHHVEMEKTEKRSKKNRYIKIASSFVFASFALFVLLINTNEAFYKSIENIPIINKIAQVFTVTEYEEKNETDLIKAKIPAIKNTGNTDLENRINYEISSKINDVITEAKIEQKNIKKRYL